MTFISSISKALSFVYGRGIRGEPGMRFPLYHPVRAYPGMIIHYLWKEFIIRCERAIEAYQVAILFNEFHC